jgi:hypothetical protein
VNLIETFATSSSADQIWFFRGLAGMKDVVEHLFGEIDPLLIKPHEATQVESWGTV